MIQYQQTDVTTIVIVNHSICFNSVLFHISVAMFTCMCPSH